MKIKEKGLVDKSDILWFIDNFIKLEDWKKVTLETKQN